MRVLVVFWVGSSLLCGQQLTVQSAAARRVELHWTGSSPAWTIERGTGSGQFEKVSAASSGSYADERIDPYATYRYRVRNQAGAVSNAVTVGPPPAGVQTPARVPAGIDAGKYGTNTALTADENGDPAVAFIWADPNGDGDNSDTTLYFVRWDRATYSWRSPVKVAVTGDIPSQNVEPASVACDSATGVFAVSFLVVGKQGVQVALSQDGGATWQASPIAADLEGLVSSTVLAASNGRWHLAFSGDQSGVRYYSGPAAAAPSEWKMQVAPNPDKGKIAPNISIAMTTDQAGKALIGYWVAPEEGNNYRVLLWSPESGRTVIAADTNGQTPDAPNLRLAIANGKTHLLLNCARDEKNTDYSIWYTASSGGAWSTPVKLPIDGPRSTNAPLALTVNSSGRIAAVFASNSGSGDTVCGYPILSLSTDGAHWTTCGPGKRTGGTFDPQPSTIGALNGPGDHLNVVWHQQGENKYGQGVLLWREP
jgi:hypothetical protein